MDPQSFQSKTNATHAATEQSTNRFVELFQGLPSELKGMIYEFTFSAGPPVQHVNQSYKPPSVLQVDRETRAKFAKSYYSLTTFKLSHLELADSQEWLATIEPKYIKLISKIHFDILDCGQTCTAEACKAMALNSGCKKKPSGLRRFAAERKSNYMQTLKGDTYLLFMRNGLQRLGVWLKPGVMHVNMQFYGKGSDQWTPDPGRSFNYWEILQRRHEGAEQFDRDVRAGRIVIKTAKLRRELGYE